MDKAAVAQRISIVSEDAFDKAVKYYTVLLSLNGIFLPKQQMNILAFTAVRGTISTGGAKEKFIQMFPTATKASIGNAIYKLTKKQLLVKVDKRIVVHPDIAIDFNRPVILKIKLNGKNS